MKYEELLELCKDFPDAYARGLITDWEYDFMESVSSRVFAYGEDTKISPKQSEVLKRIQQKVYA